MDDDLSRHLNQISKSITSFSTEEATRQGIILPILSKLGWNIFDVREVIPQYSVGNGRIDYCLSIGEKNYVFIEVKRVNEDLDKHEKQILEYSFHHGVEMAVLTNGVLWWLYLPLISGPWQQRKYFTIDIIQQDPISAARHFSEFLSRENVGSGKAAMRARELIESQEKESVLRKTIPAAWKKLLEEPDEHFLDLFADKVESMCGYRPDPEVLANFFEEKLNRLRGTESPEEVPRPNGGAAPREKIRIGGRKPRERGIDVRINGKVFHGSSVSDLYEQVLVFLHGNDSLEKLQSHIPFATSGKRYLIAREPYHPNGNRFVVPVEHQGYFMEAHKSYRNAIKALGDLLNLCKMKIETA